MLTCCLKGEKDIKSSLLPSLLKTQNGTPMLPLECAVYGS